MHTCFQALTAALLALAPTASAGTILVDDDGGVGVDFLDLPQAVNAAQSGDLILVRTGLYSPTVVAAKRLTILAELGAQVSGGVFEIHSLTSATPVVISRLEAAYEVHDSTGMVLLDSIGAAGSSRLDCWMATDVRLHNSTLTGAGGSMSSAPNAAVIVGRPSQPARLESYFSSVRGGTGADSLFDFVTAGSGSDGGQVHAGSVVDGYLAGFVGGDGGNFFGVAGGGPGDGGNGLVLLPGSKARLRPFSGVGAGAGGIDFSTLQQGTPGQPVVVDPTSAFILDDLRDPTLQSLPWGGGVFTVRGDIGGQVVLHLGLRAQVLNDGLADTPRLVRPARSFALGSITPTGSVSISIPATPALAPGATLIAQAEVDYGGGDFRRSNSAVVILAPPIP